MLDDFLTRNPEVIPDYVRNIGRCLLASGATNIAGISFGFTRRTGWFIAGREIGHGLRILFAEYSFQFVEKQNLEQHLEGLYPNEFEKMVLDTKPHHKTGTVSRVRRRLKDGTQVYYPRVVVDGLQLDQCGLGTGRKVNFTTYPHGVVHITKR